MAAFTLQDLYGHLFSYVGPPFPLANQGIGQQLLGRVPFQQLPQVLRTDPVQEVAPLSLQIEGQALWQLPIEPIIEVRSANKVVKRHAQRAEQHGTYKEYWQADDTVITIRGVFIGKDKTKLPTEGIQLFLTHMRAASISLYSPLLEALELERVVVTDWQLPHTPGLNNQAYAFRCYSDSYDYQLLEDA